MLECIRPGTRASLPAQNLALLSPPVPDGFTQVDSLPGDAERRAAGCE
jgi:hypothetical protein